jgi:hypothetical protein
MIFQFNIHLLGVKSPEVWRRVFVPAKFTFHKFHRVIQVLFGWSNSHLYEFSPKGLGSYPVITHLHSIPEGVFTDSNKYRLEKYFSTEEDKLIYTYDYGDCWEHLITLVKISEETLMHAIGFGGAGATPPEDCGGKTGFEEFKRVINDANHEDLNPSANGRGGQNGNSGTCMK